MIGPRKSRRPRAYPVVFPSLLVTAAWIALELSPGALIRPLLLALGFGAIAAVITAGLLGPDRGAIVSMALTAIVILPSPATASAVALAIGILVAVASRLEVVGRIRSPWGTLSRVLTAFTAALGVVVFVQALRLGTLDHLGDDIRIGRPAPHASAAPDVYVLLLDEHIRPDKLAEHFGDDNGLEQDLERRGFIVAKHSRSNYMATALTLLSMFDETHLTAFSGLAAMDPADPSYNRAIYAAINNNRVFDRFRKEGYETVAVAPGWEVVTIRSADLFIDAGQMSEFERYLFAATDIQYMVGAVTPDFPASQLRDRIRANADILVRLATSTHDWPRFVFAHIPSPHPPNVFRSDGSPRPGPPVEEFDLEAAAAQREGSQAFRAAYAEQVDYIDQIAMQAIDDIEAGHSRDFVMYVMSDHGARSLISEPSSGVPDIDEGTANLLAVFTSQPTPGLIDDAMAPVNVFRRFFRVEFGDDLADLPNTIYAWTGRSRFNLVEVPNPDRGPN